MEQALRIAGRTRTSASERDSEKEEGGRAGERERRKREGEREDSKRMQVIKLRYTYMSIHVYILRLINQLLVAESL
jgi:hypothetical protein